MIFPFAALAVLAVAPPADAPIVAGPEIPPAPPPASAPPASPPSVAAPVLPPPSTPGAGPPPALVTPRSSRRIDDLNKPLMGGVPQGRYEAGVAGAFAAAENLQGPLDGAWFVSSSEGRRLFRFQFDDPGYRGGKIEGAWRDLRAGPGVMEAGGFFSIIQRDGQKLTLRLSPDDGQATTLTLEPRANGGYGGQMAAGAVNLAVVMARP